MLEIGLAHYLTVAAALFALGIFGIVVAMNRKDGRDGTQLIQDPELAHITRMKQEVYAFQHVEQRRGKGAAA